MAENWLYEMTLNEIEILHSLNLKKILDFNQKIQLPSLSYTGTSEIQIDIVARDSERKILVFSECKEWPTLQGASECAEQLTMKTYLLKNHPPTTPIGQDGFNFGSLADYQLIQYISLGSYTGENYQNAKCSTVTELINRLDFYSTYLTNANKCHIGILIFMNKDTSPVSRKGILKYWKDA
jgi:hypothetical protein